MTSALPNNSAGAPLEILTLGPIGAGKTVYLASMFRRLSIERPKLGFHLEAPTDTGSYLEAVYNRVANPDRPWPAGTEINQARDSEFDCVVSDDAGGSHVPFRLRYHDYSGELVQPDEESDVAGARKELDQRVEQARTLLCLIDGHRLLDELTGRAGGCGYLASRIRPTLMIAQRTKGTGQLKPVQFVLTKFDLLLGDDTPADALKRAHDAIVADEDIMDLVQQHRAPVRLLPVSAVGPGFATLDERNRCVKVSGARARPEDVEYPMIAVLPDLADTAVKLAAGKLGFDLKELEAQLTPSVLDQLPNLMLTYGEPTVSVLKSLLAQNAQARQRADKAGLILRQVAERLASRVTEKRTGVGRRIEAVELELASTKDRHLRLVSHFRQLMAEYEDRMPASLLHAGRP